MNEIERLSSRIDAQWCVLTTLVSRIPEAERAAFWKEVEALLGEPQNDTDL